MFVRLALLAVALAAGASAQAPMPEIVGTWELVGSENVPVDDALVFARMTITEDRIQTRSVFLVTGDGQLVEYITHVKPSKQASKPLGTKASSGSTHLSNNIKVRRHGRPSSGPISDKPGLALRDLNSVGSLFLRTTKGYVSYARTDIYMYDIYMMC